MLLIPLTVVHYLLLRWHRFRESEERYIVGGGVHPDKSDLKGVYKICID